MSILIDEYDEFGKKRKVITINKADKNHPNRILSIMESKDVLNRFHYNIKVAWTP